MGLFTKKKTGTAKKKMLKANEKIHGKAKVAELQRKNKKFQEDKKKGLHRKKVLTKAEQAKAKKAEMKALFEKNKKKKAVEAQTGTNAGKLKISNKYDFTTM